MSDNDDVPRLVEWFYRATIKSPPDSVAALAREFHVSKKHVRAGIAEAKRLLDQVQPMLDQGLITLDGKGGIVVAPQRKPC